MIEEHSCKPNQGCGVMTICMCGVAEDMADEIERLRKENQELKLQYLSDQGQWIEETGRVREALRKWLPSMRKAHDRIHCLPRTSDTDLAETIDITLGVVRAALGDNK